ncbi:adenylosuccinate lyase [Candidatus Kapabacteria bacterium]|nr:adenylosuccinate lyase [Candidatus Kapabacteria bacterium]
MVERYSREVMSKIWTEQNKFNNWLEVEVLAVEAQAELGFVPKESAKNIRAKAKCDEHEILEIEKVTKHDIIAFLTNVEKYVGEDARFIHWGMTSSDVLDTALALQIKQASDIIDEDLIQLEKVLAKRAIEFKHTPCVGRSHGIHAEAMTFGMKFALWYDELQRCKDRFKLARTQIEVGMISGAVGTYEHLDPFVEKYVCDKLGLTPSNVSTQVIQRDAHAFYLHAVAMIGSLIEKIGTEIRHLQRTEVREAEEFFSKGQKGSSAMPHKRNPISSENICGQARFLRTNALAAIENNVLWHERDISHSSVERVIFPDSTISLDYILNRTIKLVDKLVVYPEKMIENMNITHGLIHSQKVLLELTKRGVQRQEAYVLVQRNAMKTWDEKIPLLENLKSDDELMNYFKPEELDNLFKFDQVFKSADFIFERLGLNK